MHSSLWLLGLAGLCLGSGVDEAMKAALLKSHNACRAGTGAGLKDLVWDDALAAFAQREVAKMSNGACRFQHTTYEERLKVPGHEGTYIGENLAWAGEGMVEDEMGSAKGDKTANVAHGVKMWCDEKKDYHISSNTCNPGAVCGHYTQIVTAKTTKVGCGYVPCQASWGTGYVLDCNYREGPSNSPPYGPGAEKPKEDGEAENEGMQGDQPRPEDKSGGGESGGNGGSGGESQPKPQPSSQPSSPSRPSGGQPTRSRAQRCQPTSVVDRSKPKYHVQTMTYCRNGYLVTKKKHMRLDDGYGWQVWYTKDYQRL